MGIPTIERLPFSTERVAASCVSNNTSAVILQFSPILIIHGSVENIFGEVP